jgi:hypothetical protein
MEGGIGLQSDTDRNVWAKYLRQDLMEPVSFDLDGHS